jgi:hypothetical protein
MLKHVQKLTRSTNLLLVVAIIFAMTGGAFAATKTKIIITSTSQISKPVLKKLEKPGAPGKEGAVGKEGLPGKQGEPGKEGKEGKEGKQGEPGKEGKQGEPGKEGKEGSFGGPLLSEKTETGTWDLSAGKEGVPVSQIGFTARLKAALGSSQVHYVGETGNGSTCPGSAANPEAEPGNLCVYEEFSQEIKTGPSIVDSSSSLFAPKIGASVAGAIIIFSRESVESTPFAYGTWAVTEK